MHEMLWLSSKGQTDRIQTQVFGWLFSVLSTVQFVTMATLLKCPNSGEQEEKKIRMEMKCQYPLNLTWLPNAL